MNKLPQLAVLIAVVMIALSTSAFALTTSMTWDDGTTSPKVFEQGDVISYDYVASDAGNDDLIRTQVTLQQLPSWTVVNTLVDETHVGGFSDPNAQLDTSSLDLGTYAIYLQGTDLDAQPNDIETSYLEFTLEAPSNDAPYFETGFSGHYEVNLSDATAPNLEDLNTVVTDPENDSLTFTLGTPAGTSATCMITNGVFGCTSLNHDGVTSYPLEVSDGQNTLNGQLVVNVLDDVSSNNEPYFNASFSGYYEFNYSQTPNNSIVNLSDVVIDPDNDSLSFSLTQTSGNSATCAITNDVFGCSAHNSIGMTNFSVNATDGIAWTQHDITVNILNESDINHAPGFYNNLTLGYHFNLSQDEVDVVDLAPYTFDADNDTITYSLAQPLSVSSAVLTPSLQPGQEGNSLLHADLHTAGTIAFEVIASDGQAQTSALIKIKVHDDTVSPTAPVAVIDAPTSAYVGDTVLLNASASYATTPGETIQGYWWNVSTPSGDNLYSGEFVTFTPMTQGNYDVQLIVVDSNGLQSLPPAQHSITVSTPQQQNQSNQNSLAAFGPESGLKIRSYEVYGFDFERAYTGGDLLILVDVENNAGQDLENIRVSFTLPEFAIRMKSSSFDLDDGEHEVVQINGFVPEFVEPGHYYPYYEISNDEIRRVKTGYLEVVEQ